MACVRSTPEIAECPSSAPDSMLARSASKPVAHVAAAWSSAWGEAARESSSPRSSASERSSSRAADKRSPTALDRPAHGGIGLELDLVPGFKQLDEHAARAGERLRAALGERALQAGLDEQIETLELGRDLGRRPGV